MASPALQSSDPSAYLDTDGVARQTLSCIAVGANILGIVGVTVVVVGVIGVVNPFWCILGAVCILVYWIESFCFSKACSYLNHVMDEADFIDYIKQLQFADPQIRFTIQNWHTETKTTTSTDASGNTKTSTRTVRVNTHRAEMSYPIQGHTDETMSPGQMLAMFHLLHTPDNDLEQGVVKEKSKPTEPLLLVCAFHLVFLPRDDFTANDLPASREKFYQENTTDVNQDKRELHELKMGHQERVMAVLHPEGADKGTERPWWCNRRYYSLCTFLFASILYRKFLFSKTQKVSWDVTKHFSICDSTTFTSDPVNSVLRSSNKKPNMKGVVSCNQKAAEHGAGGEWSVVPPEFPDVQAHPTLPAYWTNQDPSTAFDSKEKVPEMAEQLQDLLDNTFKAKATRDRHEPMPKRLKLVSAHRIEDQNLWASYALQRERIRTLRGTCSAVRDMEGSGEVKTACGFGTDLSQDINEFYLWHGTSPTGAFGIREDGFNISLAGSAVGTMFGPGAYFGECSSKSDEYAKCDNTGVFGGVYALLLCRVVCGEIFRITKSDIPAIQKALNTKVFDSVLGDREAAVGTFREFVVFNEAQIYPEFVVLYKREF